MEGHKSIKKQPTGLSKTEQSGQDSLKNNNVAKILQKMVTEQSVPPVNQDLSQKNKVSGD